MSKPAARIGDQHSCPKITPGTPPIPHGGGPIAGTGCASVLIEGKPAATVGDACTCVGEPDTIITGSSGVRIGGKPAARSGDRCAHGGMVVGGSGSVLIGGVTVNGKFDIEKSLRDRKTLVNFTCDEKEIIILQAIKDCIAHLERKLLLLEKKDRDTLRSFKKWFGVVEERSRQIIMNRIRKVLALARRLEPNNFRDIDDEVGAIESFAEVESEDDFYTIYVGNIFWEKNKPSSKTNASILIHELSHFDGIGATEDFEYGVNSCIALAVNSPDLALYNAENFEYFVVK